MVMPSKMAVIQCPLCSGSLLLPDLKAYISHLRLVHGRDPNFFITCNISDCYQEFHAFAAFNSHIYRHHRSDLGLEVAPVVSDPICHEDELTASLQSAPVYDIVEPQNFVEGEDNDQEDFGHMTRGTDKQKEQQKESAKFLLKLREVRCVSQATVLDIIDGNQDLFSRTIERVKAVVKDNLNLAGINYLDVDGLDLAMSDLSNPYEGLETIHKQNKFFADHFNYLEAHEIPYDGSEAYVNRFSGHKRQKVRSEDVFYHVPIAETLKRLLMRPEVQQELKCSRPSGDSVNDFCDGCLFRDKQFFQSSKDALQIIAYYDDLEVTNPIGSYVRKHKLGCLFFTLGNIRPKFRSSLKTIFLVAVGRYSDIAKYGIDCFLQPFVEDLKELYCDGVCVQGTEYHGALLAFLSDTLAAHSLGGFKGSMSFAKRICRSCMVTTEEAQTCFTETDCTLRTPEEHFYQTQLLTGASGDPNSIESGINRLSILEEVPEFSVIHGLPHDMMHDIFEGVVPYELKCLLSHCVNKRYFTMSELNQRIKGFDFGQEDKPGTIDPAFARDSDSKIRQSASQTISLVRNFTLLIGDKIPEGDQPWHSFLVLLKICLISLSSSYSSATASYVRVLIEEKLWLLRKLYPDMRLKPKMHYLVHYSSQIERLGPLIHTWTMRHEAKLSFIKRSSRRGNFKNIAKTVAQHHQLWLCYQLNCEPTLFSARTEVSPKVTEVPLLSMPEHIQSQLRNACQDISEDSIIRRPNWIKVQSVTYKPGVVVLLLWDEMSPRFGKVIEILQLTSDVIHITFLLLVEVFEVQYLCSHYNAYVVTSSCTTQVVTVQSLIDHHVLTIRKSFDMSDSNLYITMPYMP